MLDDETLRSTPQLLTGESNAPESPLPLPPEVGRALTEDLRARLHSVLWKDNSQLGSVYRARVAHPSLGPTDLTLHAETANAGATSNRLAVINALFEGDVPGGPTSAQQAARSVRNLRKRTTHQALRSHYDEVLDRLASVINDEEAQEQELAQLEEDSAELEGTLESSSGVYVYTYLQYWRYPYGSSETRRLLKVGQTSGEAWSRVRQQTRTTGLPEEPLLLRVYVSDDPMAAEAKFHRLLDAAEHDRSQGKSVGREWFATTIEYLDTIAEVLGLEVKSASDPIV